MTVRRWSITRYALRRAVCDLFQHSRVRPEDDDVRQPEWYVVRAADMDRLAELAGLAHDDALFMEPWP